MELLASLTAAAALVFGSLAVRRSLDGGRYWADERLLAVAERRGAGELAEGAVSLRKRASSFPLLSLFLARGDREARTAWMLERAGVRLRPTEYTLIRLFLAAVAFVIVSAIAGWSLLGVLLAVLCAIVASLLPRLAVGWKTGHRIGRMQGQFVQMLSLVSASLRSGFSLLQALDTAAKRLGPPLSDELAHVLADIRFGRKVEDALDDWSARVQNRDLQLIITAISVQRHSGGNLSEVLENLAQTMRERTEVRQQVNALTAYARLSSRIIALYPLAIAGLLTLLRPDTWSVLWTEPIGYAMLGAAFILNMLAFSIMTAMAKVDY